MNIDVICLSETHLKENEIINMSGYIWYGKNRTSYLKSLKKGSGGVGILVSTKVFNIFDVSIVDKSTEGILVLQLKNKYTDFEFIVVSCYLPPDGSYYANTDTFLSHLISQIYINNNEDCMIIGSDINCHTGA